MSKNTKVSAKKKPHKSWQFISKLKNYILAESEQNKIKTEDFLVVFCEQSENTSLDKKYTQYPSANWRTLTFAGEPFGQQRSDISPY